MPRAPPLTELLSGPGVRLSGLRLEDGGAVVKVEQGEASLQIRIEDGQEFDPARGTPPLGEACRTGGHKGGLSGIEEYGIGAPGVCVTTSRTVRHEQVAAVAHPSAGTSDGERTWVPRESRVRCCRQVDHKARRPGCAIGRRFRPC